MVGSSVAARLTDEIGSICPIHGVSIGRVNDKETWKVHFAESATPEQIESANSVVEAFDPKSAQPAAWTPYTIVVALERMGVAEAMLSNTNEITKAKFFAGSLIREDEPLLVAGLAAVGRTIDDLKTAIG